MDINSFESSHLDSNTLLPPRKRLLAGLKKPTPDIDFSIFEARMNNLMNSCLENPNISIDEAVEACRNDAASALELAMRKRAFALDKAETAAKAMAAAKKALDLVACMSEDEENNERFLKKNRMKKHLHVETMYKKKTPMDDSKRAITGTSRASKSSTGKSSKSKRPKLDGNGFTGDVHDFRAYESTLKSDKLKVVVNGEQAGTSQHSK